MYWLFFFIAGGVIGSYYTTKHPMNGFWNVVELKAGEATGSVKSVVAEYLENAKPQDIPLEPPLATVEEASDPVELEVVTNVLDWNEVGDSD